MKEFQQEGIYYFSTDFNQNDQQENSTKPLAIIVVPNVRFHYRSVHKNDFDSLPILTNVNDFVIWQFDHIVSHNLVQLDSNEKLPDLIASHERAIAGRNRQCLAVECMIPGTFFFANPGKTKNDYSFIDYYYPYFDFRIRTRNWFRTGSFCK
jgi:hypothetical protein